MFEFRELPELVERVGTIIEEEQVCPGIYLLSAQNDEDLLARDYYAVTEKSTIPQKAKSYGLQLPGLWLFSLDDGNEEYKIIKYEVAKYRTKNHLLLDEPLCATAYFAGQVYPEYFGAFPVPVYTSRGRTTRHWILDNGIYWLETDRCEEILAVSYPVWSSELSDLVLQLGEQTEYDKAHNIENTWGYIFFPAAASCIPLRELLYERPKWEGTVIDKPALMNAICSMDPEYAFSVNQQEQLGKSDGISQLLADFGVENSPNVSQDRLISIFPDAGEAFLLLDGRT